MARLDHSPIATPTPTWPALHHHARRAFYLPKGAPHMGKNKRSHRITICLHCNNIKRHEARGLCKCCYNRIREGRTKHLTLDAYPTGIAPTTPTTIHHDQIGNFSNPHVTTSGLRAGPNPGDMKHRISKAEALAQAITINTEEAFNQMHNTQPEERNQP